MLFKLRPFFPTLEMFHQQRIYVLVVMMFHGSFKVPRRIVPQLFQRPCMTKHLVSGSHETEICNIFDGDWIVLRCVIYTPIKVNDDNTRGASYA